jgi:hypothetical protein
LIFSSLLNLLGLVLEVVPQFTYVDTNENSIIDVPYLIQGKYIVKDNHKCKLGGVGLPPHSIAIQYKNTEVI